MSTSLATPVASEWHNREEIEDFAVRWHWVLGPEASGFTAVLRVKNEARGLPHVLPGILRGVAATIVVDNGSTDGTPDIARAVAEAHGVGDRLTVMEYPFQVSRCGPEHLATKPDSVHSLTYFYNWSFSHVRTRYALKWDGDMVLTDEGEQVLRDLAWQLEATDAAVTVARQAVYVADERTAFVDLGFYNREPWGWRNKPECTFSKAFDWELRVPLPGEPIAYLPDGICFELKWLDEDEFSHWSHTDFKATINARKRREWEVFHALRDAGPLPDRTFEVRSPPGIDIVDHVRATFGDLVREHGVPVPEWRL